MKKSLIIFIGIIFFILTIVYLGLNSPYMFNLFAKRYAPQYYFSYKEIDGNPIQGIYIKGLKYKGKKLSKNIRLRINPYTLLEGKITISRLELKGVDIDNLKQMSSDFVKPTKKEQSSPKDSSMSIPFSFEMKNIAITILPFKEYGIDILKQELYIDSIYYDKHRFNVGNLREVINTSLGEIKLFGTYHRRFLNIKQLKIKDIDVKGLNNLVRDISKLAKSDSKDKYKDKNSTTQDNIFIPHRVQIHKISASLHPYSPLKRLHIEHLSFDGKELDIDLVKSRINNGFLTLRLKSNIAKSILNIQFKPRSILLKNGIVKGLDLQLIDSLIKKSGDKEIDDKNATKVSRDNKIPFLARFIDIGDLKIELKPEEFKKIKFEKAITVIRNFHLDIKEKHILRANINSIFKASLIQGELEADINSKRIHIKKLELKDINPNKIKTLFNRSKIESNSSKKVLSKRAKEFNSLKIPYLPSFLKADHLLLLSTPFIFKKFEANQTLIEGDNLDIDLNSSEVKNGEFKAQLDANLLKGNLIGIVKNNHLTLDSNGSNHFIFKKKLFDLVGIPSNPKSFSTLILGGEADRQKAVLQAIFKANKIFSENNSSFTLDINRSMSHFDFNFIKGEYRLIQEINASTPQMKINLFARVDANTKGKMKYKAKLRSPAIYTSSSKLNKLLTKPKIDIEGDLHHINMRLDSKIVEGSFISKDFKKGLLYIHTKKKLPLSLYIKLPNKLKDSKIDLLQIYMPVNFSHIFPLDANATLRSNLVNIKLTGKYNSDIKAKLFLEFPKKSLIKAWLPNLELKSLNPLKITIESKKKIYKAYIKSNRLNAKLNYSLVNKIVNSKIYIAKNKIEVNGDIYNRVQARLDTNSLHNFLKAINSIYRFPLPKIDGDLHLKIKLNRLQELELELHSRKFIPNHDSRIKSPIRDIDLLASTNFKKHTVLIKRYHFQTEGFNIFSKHYSHIFIKNSKVSIKDFWINDSLKIVGEYNFDKNNGKFIAKGSHFRLKHKNAKIESNINITTKIRAKKIDTRGKIIILGGKLDYNLKAKHYARDDDIIIIQRLKKEKESFFRKNIQLNLNIKTKKALLFHKKEANIRIKPQLTINKTFNAPLQIFGSIKLEKGGYYIFKDKKFHLASSSINFVGKATKPLLDINLIYHRYGRTVYISISGSATEPGLQFTSEPFMTQNQILSFILFDTVDYDGNSDDMVSLLGGSIGKSILGNIGLKVDTLIINSNGFKVGKKISRKITLFYDQSSKEPKIIVRVKYSKHIHTNIDIGNQSQSADIIYKNDY